MKKITIEMVEMPKPLLRSVSDAWAKAEAK